LFDGPRHHIGAPEIGSRRPVDAIGANRAIGGNDPTGADAHDPTGKGSRMRIVATSNDPVRLSFLTALLADAGITAIMLDLYTSATEGSIGAIPRRLAVAPDDEAQARRVLAEAGEA
jgi:hypothetical protein